jgi:DNA-binding LacI/PurR family transcriptional regulator
MRSLEKAGFKAPRDVRVVGFDDVKYATLLSVPLTTIHQPCRDIAAVAFKTMLDRIADPTAPASSRALTPRLVVRESCGAYLQRGKG